MSRRLEITVSDGTWERLDQLRGHEPRASFVKRALDAALRVPELDQLGPSPSPGVVRAAAKNAASVLASEVGRCPKATCRHTGLVGGTCPDHRNLRFKA